MKKIITAIGNSILNKKIKQSHIATVLAEDISNDEKLIEWLDCGEKVDILFVSSNIIKNYKIDEFIRIIRKIQDEVTIYFFKDEKIKINIKENKLKIYTNSTISWEFIEK